jgi:hypothetical protein
MAITSSSNKTVNKGEEQPIKQHESPSNECAQSINFLSYGISDVFSSSNSDIIPATSSERTKDIPKAMPKANSKSIPEHTEAIFQF